MRIRVIHFLSRPRVSAYIGEGSWHVYMVREESIEYSMDEGLTRTFWKRENSDAKKTEAVNRLLSTLAM